MRLQTFWERDSGTQSQTIKQMSARCGKSIDYCVFWYNITPYGSKGIIPSSKLISYEWRNSFLEVEINSEIDDGQESDKRAYSVNDKVWVKPHGARCNSLWNPGIVTKVNSKHNVEVDGMPRHVCDKRRRWANQGERDNESLISANLPTVGPNFVLLVLNPTLKETLKGVMPLWKMATM